MKIAMIGGAGWRAEFFYRICRELPDRFQMVGALVRDAEKGERVTREWGVPTFRDLDSLLTTNPAYVVVSVPWGPNPGYLRELAARGVPALSETPPAPDLDGLNELYRSLPGGFRIQVAEQFQFQPLNAALIALARSGSLGEVSQAQVSVGHGYHGISVMRKLLGISFEDAEIRGVRFASPIVTSPGRSGPPETETISESGQEIATFDFGGKLGVFDFTGDQYFSYIRSRRVLVRGERGEINGLEVRTLADPRTPLKQTLVRLDAGIDGNHEGFHHKGILLGSDWIYRNPFPGARLNDEEIAIATCMQKMAEYVEGGPGFCSLADASQDHYLSIAMKQAIDSGAPVRTSPQSWAG